MIDHWCRLRGQIHGNFSRLTVVLLAADCLVRAVDQNNNQQSDVWDMSFQAANLPAAGDFDADGWSNAAENSAGTNPKSAASHPGLEMALVAQMPTSGWVGLKGKHYGLLSSSNLTSFSPTADVATAFLMAVFCDLMQQRYRTIATAFVSRAIRRILIGDASGQVMPKSNADAFPAHGNHYGKTAGVKIDFAFDLLTGSIVGKQGKHWC